MKIVLEVIAGPCVGRIFRLPARRLHRIGRVELDGIAVPDETLSRRHFSLEWDGVTCRLQDLHSTNGTFLNGERVMEAVVHEGDQIYAGETTFVVHLELGEAGQTVRAAAAPASAVAASPGRPVAGTRLSVPEAAAVAARLPRRPLLEVLRSQPEPLYALLDAARDPRILELVTSSSDLFQSLYEGEKGQELAMVAPYLVHLSENSSLLEILVRQGWGKNWGVFLTCARSFQEVRRHFRHFLLVQLDDGRTVYFRFYDPRVLRVFLPTCTAGEAQEFAGPVSGFLVEAETPQTLLRFAPEYGAARAEVIPVAVG